jgi:hypothetical protein
MKSSFALTAILMLTTCLCSAQENDLANKAIRDSIGKLRLEQAAINNPILRQVHISTDLISSGNLESKLLGEEFLKGKASTIRTTVVVNIPVLSWGKNKIIASGTFFQQELSAREVKSKFAEVDGQDFDFNKGTVGLTASFQRRDSLFGRPVFYMASISGVTNEPDAIKKVSFLGTAVFPMKQTAKTRTSLGLVVNIDPGLKIPAFVIFSYWHQFDNEIELNFNVPSSVGLRRAFSDRLWATFGTTLGGSLAFFDLNSPNLPRDVNYTTMDLRTGLGAEYRLGKKVIVGVNGGMLTPLSARAFDRNKSASDHFLSNKISNAPYVNFSLSLLPFLKRKF